MKIHRLFLSPSDQHPVHCIGRPVLHRNAGHLQYSDVLDRLLGKLCDLLVAQAFFAFAVFSDLAEDALRQFLFLIFPFHEADALPDDLMKAGGRIPVGDKRYSFFFIVLRPYGKCTEHPVGIAEHFLIICFPFIRIRENAVSLQYLRINAVVSMSLCTFASG